MVFESARPAAGASRQVILHGARNFRDLGGYATAVGQTAWGRIYRADTLARLSQDDVAGLVNRGLATVVDLRFEREVRAHPDVFEGHASVRYHHNPVLLEDVASGGAAERMRTLDVAAHNIAMIKQSGQTFANLFRLLGQTAAYPLVFHCAGGRDRTGVAAALVLTAAGVSRADVIEDYVVSNAYLVQTMVEMSEAFRKQGVDPEPIIANLELREGYLVPMLDVLEADFGGVEGYLQTIGVTSEELETFRSQMRG